MDLSKLVMTQNTASLGSVCYNPLTNGLKIIALCPRSYSSVVVQCPVMPIFILGKFNFALVGLDRSFKAAGVEKKSAKAAPSSLSLKSDERAEKRREVIGQHFPSLSASHLLALRFI